MQEQVRQAATDMAAEAATRMTVHPEVEVLPLRATAPGPRHGPSPALQMAAKAASQTAPAASPGAARAGMQLPAAT